MDSLLVSESVLPNGMMLVEMPVSGRLATAIAVVFAAGSRHERVSEVGVAHLLEHLAFKGTERYPTAAALNRAAESLGLDLAGISCVDYVGFSTLVRGRSGDGGGGLAHRRDRDAELGGRRSGRRSGGHPSGDRR